MEKNVYIFKMNENLNDDKSIYEIQKEYFEEELKKNVNGKYRIPHRKFRGDEENTDDKGYLFDEEISKKDTILFSYKDKFIATANVVDGQYFQKITEENKEDWNDGGNEELDHFYQFDVNKIHIIPAIDIENCKEFFNEEKIANRNSICKLTLKEEKYDEFRNLLNSKRNKSKLSKNWKKYSILKKLLEPSLLKEINLYNYENIHTAFLCNFLKYDNSYGYKDKPYERFIDLLKSKTEDSDLIQKLEEIKKRKNYDIKPQFKYENIQPDITIDIEGKKINYHIVVETKICAEENKYDNNKTQLKEYYDYFKSKETNTEKFIFVYLTMKQQDENENKEYIKITFKDIYNKIYKCYSNNILNEYLESYKYLCDKEKFNFKITEIPPVKSSKFCKDLKELLNDKKIKEDIENISLFKIPDNIEKKYLYVYRYLLVLMYNSKIDNKIKGKIEKCYNNFG